MITVTRDKIDELAAYYDEHDTTADLERAVPREPVPADEVMIVTSLRLPKPVMDQVRERAQERGSSPPRSSGNGWRRHSPGRTPWFPSV